MSVLSLFTKFGATLKPVNTLVNLVQDGSAKALFPESENPTDEEIGIGAKAMDGVVHLCQWFGKHDWRPAQNDQERELSNSRWSIRPFGVPTGSTSEILSDLLHFVLTAHKESLCCLSFYLSPCTITPAERQWLWNQVRILQRDADLGPYFEDDPQKRLSDPLFEIESRNLQFFASSLEPAFTSVAEVWVRDEDEETSRKTALQIGHGVASAIELAQDTPHSPAFSELLPGKCRVAEPIQAALDLFAQPGNSAGNIRELQRTLRGYAMQTYNELNIRHWIPFAYGLRGEDVVRVPYLVNPAGASVFFRLPVDLGGGLPGLRLRQAPPDFDPGEARKVDEIDSSVNEFDESDDLDDQLEIVIGQLHSGGRISIKRDDLTRHTLIVGNTGSGKTWTTKHILSQLDVPFLVIETAKKEYRNLLLDPRFFRDNENPISVLTPGSEGVTPIRINPFELLAGVRVESHIGALLTCFEAALPLEGPLFAILEEGLVQAYTSLGWKLAESATDREVMPPPFPTMTWFSLHLARLAASRGYQGELHSNIRAAISGRISPLTTRSGTSKGKLLDTHLSYPKIADLFEQRVVIELNDLRAEEKSLVTMFLLVFLREYRESDLQQNPDLMGLRHITVIEEAHNILASQPQGSSEESPNARNAAVERFSNMLTEMRSLGEGLIIADQSPHKILPDAIRNTNLQVVHQLRAEDDQKAASASMVMSEKQERFLAKLHTGNAAVFFTGLERATFVKIPRPPILAQATKETMIKIQDDRHLRSIFSSAANHENGLLRDSPRNWAFRACLSCPEAKACPSQVLGARVANNIESNLLVFLTNDLAKLGDFCIEKRACLATLQVLIDHAKAGEAASPASAWCSLSQSIDRLHSSLIQDDSIRMNAEQLAIQIHTLAFEGDIFPMAKRMHTIFYSI